MPPESTAPENPEKRKKGRPRKVTALQTIPNYRKMGQSAAMRGSRALFLAAFERFYGNVSRSCIYAGISRQTYYRWLKSPSRVNVKFREKLARIQPKELQIDVAENIVMQHVELGDLEAAKFVLRTQGRIRGYGERPAAEDESLNDGLAKVGNAFGAWLEDHPDATAEEKSKWLARFAQGGGVEPKALAKLVGIEEQISEVQNVQGVQ